MFKSISYTLLFLLGYFGATNFVKFLDVYEKQDIYGLFYYGVVVICFAVFIASSFIVTFSHTEIYVNTMEE